MGPSFIHLNVNPAAHRASYLKPKGPTGLEHQAQMLDLFGMPEMFSDIPEAKTRQCLSVELSLH